MFSFFGKYKKPSFNIFLGFFLLFSVFSSMFPERAYAQMAVTDVPAMGQREALANRKTLETTITQKIVSGVLSAAIQSVSYYAQEFAYRSAVWVASSDKGRKSLVEKESWGDFLENTALNAAAVAIQDFGKNWGFDICRFPDLNLQLYLEIGLRQMDRPTLDCSWQELKNTFGQYKDLAKDTADFMNGKNPAAVDRAIARKFTDSLRVNNTDFGVAAGAIIQVDKMVVQKEKAAYAERTTNKGFKDLGSIISGSVQTPGEVIGEETKKELSRKDKQNMEWSQIGSIYGSGAYEIIPSTVAMFINTLVNTYAGRILPFNPDESSYTDPEIVYNSNSSGSSYAFDQLEAAKTAFSFLRAVAPQAQVNDYDTLLSEMAICPDQPGTNNCVMDSGMQSVLSLQEHMTIRQALEKGYLHGDWELISPRRPSEHESITGCLTDKYCYSNIQKMRKARLLPLGFEVAALRSDPDHPWTLKDVVDGFDKCDYTIPGVATSTVANPAFPFCHLINPNWILQLPKYRCDAMVYSDNLEFEGSATRQYECADLSSCISFNADGSCAGWGYCTKEKNTWEIKVDKCEAQYNTCTTFVNDENKQITSYLAKTVDYGKCTADNTGCRAYSLSAVVDPRGGTTTWKASIHTSTTQKQYGDTQTGYFNAKIKNLSTACNANNDGCSAFWQADILDTGLYVDRISASTGTDYAMTNSLAYLKKAPDYLTCYDQNLATPGLEWPRTVPEANEVVARNSLCDNFAAACLREEVGCEAFTPADGGASIPGKIGATNFCAAECVGYETFKQEASEFEPAKFPMYFIGSQADICSAEAVGCSEFTNMDALSRGGEAIEYYSHLEYCEKPNNDSANPNVRTFYSWEGSANTGYNIITHKLKPLTQSDANTIALETPGIVGFIDRSPAYVLTTPEALRGYYSKCNEAAYNILLSGGPDASGAASTNCKALFDDAGNTYYRLTDYTVVVDETCHPLRKTELVFEPETRPGYNNQGACESIHDRWNTSVAGAPFCERCINGGKFEGGFCVYQTISRPDVSTTCTKEENGCRAYTGNTVGNIEDVIALEDFEPFAESNDEYAQALGFWRQQDSAGPKLRIVKEATHNGKHSLQVDPGVTLVRDMTTSTFEKDTWYELSFVAKSIAGTQPLKIEVKQGNAVWATFASVAKPAKVESSWNVYKFGPIQFTGNSNIPSTLVFDRTAGDNAYFIDQVRLRRISKMQNYIKDSWKNKNGGLEVPMSCDSLPEDRLPGEALGCESYKDSNEITRYAVGFERLCREKAIGCQPLWDTHNTLEGDASDRAQAFNVLCFGTANATCKIVHNEQELGNCFVPRGESSCYVPKIVIPTGLTWDTFKTAMNANNLKKVDLDASSIVTLADTPESTPIFLASGEKQKYACDKGAVSCQKSGLEEKYLPSNATTSFQFSEFFVKNDPDKYTETICRNDLVGCTKYSDAGKETYFKDPVVTGGSLCKWKNPGENENRTYGWFLEGISHCQNNADILCKADSDCGEGDTCLQIDVACAPDHMVGDGMYDIWSNETPLKYQGNVGICPATANQCREIIDRQDTSHVNPDGKPYYLIFNEKVAKKRDGTECPGNQVSLTEGCVLFDKTDEPNKLYDSAASYKRSEKKPDNPYGLVPPVTANDPASSGFRVSDSNLVLKVDRSRECSEWLGCESQALVKKDNGEYTYVCEKVGACEKLGLNNGECGGNVDPLSSPEDNNLAMNRLTNDQYVSRKVSWFDEEFSGYSLYNRFQIGNLMYIYFKFPKAFDDLVGRSAVADHSYVARVVSESLFRGNDGLDKDCYADDDSPTNWSICGFDDGGRCYNNNCIYPVDGVFKPEEVVDPAYIATLDDLSTPGAHVPGEMWEEISKIIARLEPDSCKSAPENDSPFSSEISEEKKASVEEGSSVYRNYSVERKPGFENTNFCQDGECTCSYKKISYKNGVIDYWPNEVKVRQPAANICAGGPREGSPCTTDSNICNDGNSKYECVPTTREDVFIGYSGFCLEYDLGRPNKYNGQYPCLTWLPVQGSVSPLDLYNAEKNAGYNPEVDAKVNDEDTLRGGVAYCTEATVEKIVPNMSIVEEAFNYYDDCRIVEGNSDNNTSSTDKDAFPPFINDPEVGDDAEGCIRIGACAVSVFHDNFCSPSQNANDGSDRLVHYHSDINYAENFLQNWSASEIGLNDPTAKVLRIEKNHEAGAAQVNGDYNSIYPLDLEKLQDCGQINKPICRVYGLTPQFSAAGEIVNQKPKEGFLDLGVMMHPPRLFEYVDSDPDILKRFSCILSSGLVECESPCAEDDEQCQIDFFAHSFEDGGKMYCSSDGYADFDRADEAYDQCMGVQQVNGNDDIRLFQYTSQNRKISPLAYSPEFRTSIYRDYNNDDPGYNGTNWFINSFIEQTMTWNSLKRVYFLPTGYPGGAEGQLPSLMNEDMYLDFLELDTAKERGNPLIIQEIYTTDPGNINDNGWNEKFFAKSTGKGGKLFKYLLTGDDIETVRESGIVNVTGDLSNDNLSLLDPNLVQRNEVNKRYVLYFRTAAEINSEIGEGDAVENIDGRLEFNYGGDPFTDDVRCNEDTFTWLAIGMDFNSEGEFLGYVTRFCMAFDEYGHDGGGWQDYGIQYAVVATFNNMCKEVNKVYDTRRVGFTSFMRDDSNKAWTNRVWRYASEDVPKIPNASYFGLKRHFQEIPFGSLNLDDTILDNRTQLSYLQKFVYNFYNVEWSNLTPVRGGAGIPFSCEDGDCENLNSNAEKPFGYTRAAVAVLNGKTKNDAYNLLHQLFAKEYLRISIAAGSDDQACVDKFARDYSFNSFGLVNCSNNQVFLGGEFTLQIPGFPLNRFGKVCDGIVTEEENRLGESLRDCVNSLNNINLESQDFSIASTTLNQAGNTVKLLPPQIYSIQPYRCLEKRDSVCTAWEKDSFTIGNYNGSLGDYDGDGRNDEDKDGNESPDPLVVFGNMYYARMRFFAFADDNRMPIRRIKIDWADSTPRDQLDKRGLYKNRKPVCEESDILGDHLSMCVSASTGKATGMPCLKSEDIFGNYSEVECPIDQVCKSLQEIQNGSLGDEYKYKQFGNLPRACENHYFEYSHQYTCSSEEVDKVRLTGGDGGDGPIMRIDNPLLGSGVTNVLRTYPGVDYVCAFKPKVQIEDNWGWCNGSCTKVYNNQGNPIGGDTPAEQIGCYNAWPAPKNNDPDYKDDQCIYPMDPDSDMKPWTEYKQYVIMVPSREE